MSKITPRIWLFLVKFIVNISTITLEIWDHYHFSFSEVGISGVYLNSRIYSAQYGVLGNSLTDCVLYQFVRWSL